MAAASPAQGARPVLAEFTVWRPFLVRAVVSGVFGLLTIFWREPSTLVMSIVGGLYFLLVGAAYLWTHRMRHWGAGPRVLTDIGGGLLLGAGAAVLVLRTEAGFAFAGAAALVVAGAAELVRGLAARGHAAARDLVVVGVVGIATGAILPFVEPLGAHALLGVTGGGALLTAVVLGIAALSYRHDSALSAPPGSGSQGPADPVN
ncbi:hypothetical protein [Arthrobacter sp. L77]|uniref:hypothetical protein n=1 Tax=Arthrobacter sp. L77 TaxID=1496689 RepID=UPI000B31BFD3|nr:hypothetical protein [Arthrobacter sp. L77]